MSHVRKEAADLNSKVSNWVYIISSSKYQLLVKRPQDLLDDKKEAAEEPLQTDTNPG